MCVRACSRVFVFVFTFVFVFVFVVVVVCVVGGCGGEEEEELRRDTCRHTPKRGRYAARTRSMRMPMLVASDEATSGSVMAKQLRMCLPPSVATPRRRHGSQRATRGRAQSVTWAPRWRSCGTQRTCHTQRTYHAWARTCRHVHVRAAVG